MQLAPCCHTSTWNLDGGRLNCVLSQRSGDMPYGVPFNTTQYAELMIMFAKDLGVSLGILTHVIADAHIYENQMKGVEQQMRYWEAMSKIASSSNQYIPVVEELAKERNCSYYDMVQQIVSVLRAVPKFCICSETNDFFSYNADQCTVENYQYMGKIDFGEVAV